MRCTQHGLKSISCSQLEGRIRETATFILEWGVGAGVEVRMGMGVGKEVHTGHDKISS